MAYFKENMSEAEQVVAVEELTRLSKLALPVKPHFLQLLDIDIPDEYKAIAYRKMTSLRELEPGSGEYHKLKQWLATLMQIPFGKYSDLPVDLKKSTIGECSEFMSKAKSTLDSAVFGLNDVKEQVYQLIGQWIANPQAIGTAIAIEGPMGTGKTTLVREGISKAMGRDFVFVALGGATDSSFLEGHSYTYEGAMHGRIVDGLTKCKTMNPVFFFDELDKVSDTARGQEIIGILTHLTDTSQNKEFQDKYFSQLTFDLSRALFVFSYNDASKINPILRDRMHKLTTRGYKADEKVSISRGYLIPAAQERVCFDDGRIIISDVVLKYIVDHHTKSEKGVRNLQRCLGAIYTKLNLLRMVSDPELFMKSDSLLKLSLPLTLTIAHIDTLLGKTNTEEGWRHMYM
jgi:ATP-dependent Lon protease